MEHNMDTLTTAFGPQIKKAMTLSKVVQTVTEHNVFQEADKNILPFLDEIVDALILPGSGVDGMENLEELLAKAESGKSCLVMVEHYSNLDLSLVSSLLRKQGGQKISDAFVAIAGLKLNEDNPAIAAFSSAYTRLVIYPSRSLKGLDAEKDRAEIIRYNTINRAALKALNEIKTKGKLILVFPSGTRYRAWDPSTKKGVREIDAYIRSFDYLCCLAINGECLHVQQSDMMNDVVAKDLVRITAGPVISCAEFRAKARAAAEITGIEDKKQATVDAVMTELEKMHIAAEEKRRKLLLT
jgi:glycerol-3-phosphate O-acyltransferase